MIKRLFVALAMIATPVLAQNNANIATPSQISVASRGEVKVNPDKATIQISVQTRSATAAAAATENASKQKAVIDALKALGLKDADISTSGYTVNPEQRYEPNKEPVVVAYNVTNSLSVEVKSLKLVGPVIDASLAKGANMVNSLQFSSSNTDNARRTAIALAIEHARADAEAAAKAAGGSLGGLLEVSIGAYYPPPPRPFAMEARAAMAKSDETPINPGEQTVSVEVNTRWLYLGPGR